MHKTRIFSIAIITNKHDLPCPVRCSSRFQTTVWDHKWLRNVCVSWLNILLVIVNQFCCESVSFQRAEGSRGSAPCGKALKKIKAANGSTPLHRGLKENLLCFINSVKAWLIHPRVQRCYQIHTSYVLCSSINTPLGEEQQQHGCFQVDVRAEPFRLGESPGSNGLNGGSLDVESPR